MSDARERSRLSFDFCTRKGEDLPAAAFCFDDLCCTVTSDYFSLRAFTCLEEIAKSCDYYENKG